jgi:hypothetical protein
MPMLPLERGRGLVSALAPLLEAALADMVEGRP